MVSLRLNILMENAKISRAAALLDPSLHIQTISPTPPHAQLLPHNHNRKLPFRDPPPITPIGAPIFLVVLANFHLEETALEEAANQ
jgi:hypothetical protein